MKIRLGFVGNSSSSSFMVFGVQITDKELMTELEHLEGDKKYPGEFREEISCTKNNLDCYHTDEGTFIGMHPNAIRIDETRAQFGQRVKDALLKAGKEFGIDLSDLLVNKSITYYSGEYPN